MIYDNFNLKVDEILRKPNKDIKNIIYNFDMIPFDPVSLEFSSKATHYIPVQSQIHNPC